MSLTLPILRERVAPVRLGLGAPFSAVKAAIDRLIDFDGYTQAEFETEFTAAPYTFARASNAYARGADGYLDLLGPNVPRLEHDEYGIPLGYLSEPAATNLLAWSQAFDNAAWSKASTSVVANAATAPDGTLSADKIIPPDDGYVYARTVKSSAVSIASGSHYVASVYVKEAGFRYLHFRCNGYLATPGPTLDLETGAFPYLHYEPGIDSYGAILGADGWWRLWFAFTSNTTSADLQIRPSHYADSANTEGDGSSGVLVWQADLVAAKAPSSPIKTEAAAASRAADSLYRDITGELDEGGFMAVEGDVAPLTNAALLNAGNGVDTSDRVLIYRSAASALRYSIISGGAGDQLNEIDTIVDGQKAAAAVRWAQDDFGTSTNGGSIASDDSGDIPTGLVSLDFMHRTLNGSLYNSGVLSRVRYGDTQPDDDALALMSIPKSYRANFARMTQAEAAAILTSGIWSFSRPSIKLVTGAAGKLVEIPTNTPALQHDASGRCLGYLPEAAATNQVRSDDVLTYDLANGTNTISTGTYETPEGDTTTKVFRCTGAVVSDTPAENHAKRNTGSFLGNSLAIPSGDQTLSVWFKFEDADSWLKIQAYHYAGGGTIEATTADYEVGVWHRLSVSGAAVASDRQCRLYIRDGKTVQFWQPQLEAGLQMTSTIKTTDAPASRAADVLFADVSGVFDEGGTVVCEAEKNDASATYFHSLRDSGGADYAFCYQSGSNILHRVSAGGVAQFNSSQAFTPIDGAFLKVAHRFGGGTSIACLGGALTAEDPSVDDISVNRLYVGNVNGGGQRNGAIADLRWTSAQLTDAQLEALTE